MRTKFKPWAKPYMLEHPEVVIPFSDEINVAKYEKIILEVGTGKGQFIANLASLYPNYLFIGVEKNVSVAGICTKRIVESGLTNVRIIDGDIVTGFELWKNTKFDNIFLNFSDPWPKKKHAKRRLTSESFLKGFYNILKPNGEVYIKTDNKLLYEYSLQTIADSEFTLIGKDENYLVFSSFDTQTEYEQNFRKEGKPIYRIVIRR